MSLVKILNLKGVADNFQPNGHVPRGPPTNDRTTLTIEPNEAFVGGHTCHDNPVYRTPRPGGVVRNEKMSGA
jgi:hypothetical protein